MEKISKFCSLFCREQAFYRVTNTVITTFFEYVYLLLLNSTDDKDIVDQAILRAEKSEPNIFDPSKFNLVEEVSTKVRLFPIFIISMWM